MPIALSPILAVLAHHQLPESLFERGKADTDVLALLVNLANFTAKAVPELKKVAYDAKADLIRLALELKAPGMRYHPTEQVLYWRTTRWGQFSFHGLSNRGMEHLFDPTVQWEGVRLQPLALGLVQAYLAEQKARAARGEE